MTSSDGIAYDLFIEHHVRTGETLASLAEKYGLAWQDLAQCNFGTDVPREVNQCLHEFTGCTKRTQDGKNYVFSDRDVPGIIYIPKLAHSVTLPTGKRHRVRVKRPRLYARIEVQAVDELGHRVEDVDLTLRSLDGFPDVVLRADNTGYGKVDKLLAGRYRVLLASGDPAWMFKATSSSTPPSGNDGSDRLEEAIIDTRHHTRAIASVVVARALSDEERDQHRLLNQVYDRTADKTTLEGRGEETSGNSSRSYHYCTDNLALGACCA